MGQTLSNDPPSSAAAADGAAAAKQDGAAAEIDAWLRGSGLVVAASERAARAATAAFHRRRRGEGLSAWPAPNIRDWNGFLRDAWRKSSRDDRLILNAAQEQALWVEVVGGAHARDSAAPEIMLDGPRQRLAALALRAHALLCAYSPRYLDGKARRGWQQDADAFSGWLAAFDSRCRSLHALSAARVPLELISALEADAEDRPPLLLVGFDRLAPTQRKMFDAWGRWSHAQAGSAASRISFYEAPDDATELEACAIWCKNKLDENSGMRLLVVAQDLAQRRGEIERAFLRHAGAAGSQPLFEFSLGIPLSSVALARGALLTLRWLNGPLEEREIDWLFSTRQTTKDDPERYALTGFMRTLRRRDRQRTRWTLDAFLAQQAGTELPRSWAERMIAAKRKLAELSRNVKAPHVWAELAPELLRMVGWPGARSLASAEYQVLRRWQHAIDECASLGFDGRRVSWDEFLAVLERVLDATLFAPESQDAPIQIAGPAESAGLTADAIWFLGASDNAWPGGGPAHPLLPIGVQREAAMPHASAQIDWEASRAVTTRLLASAREAHFSYPRQSEGIETRASRVVTGLAGDPHPLPHGLRPQDSSPPRTIAFPEDSRVPLGASDSSGGATILTTQSQCPFKAFATARLGARGWEPAQAGLTPAQRGQLLHSVLHSVWGGAATAGIRTHGELVALGDLRTFVAEHVRRVLAAELPAAAREEMPRGYLDLEEVRLVKLVTEWLELEAQRAEFAVARAELDVSRSIAGLTLDLRLDRIDRLENGSLLVVDYKTGTVSPTLWKLPRPEDVQLPLYALFGLDEDLRARIAHEFNGDASRDRESMPQGGPLAAPLDGLVFAKVRSGECCFAGRVNDAKTTLLPGLKASTDLARKKLEEKELAGWRDYVERMARDFLGGRAEVDPRDYPRTCERCDLQALCRVQENRAGEEEADDEETHDE